MHIYSSSHIHSTCILMIWEKIFESIWNSRIVRFNEYMKFVFWLLRLSVILPLIKIWGHVGYRKNMATQIQLEVDTCAFAVCEAFCLSVSATQCCSVSCWYSDGSSLCVLIIIKWSIQMQAYIAIHFTAEPKRLECLSTLEARNHMPQQNYRTCLPHLPLTFASVTRSVVFGCWASISFCSIFKRGIDRALKMNLSSSNHLYV